MASLEGQPLVQRHHDDDVDDHLRDLEDTSSSWCGGCFRWRGSSGGGGGERESWVAEKFRKVKEFSEVVAGPKWKTFIRKISAYFNGKRHNQTRFHYDQHSYALNFNNSDDDLDLPPSFSSRFTVPRPQPQSSS
ncbi:hypothetical protein QN277_007073 [Acacia crassicarpa]|uniref:Stress induced protein n=1 Tax=Acacia crassicarpa TaxID=499986 RepID=A0AAE1JTT3_9FABA|nr:hypothetical protein QN277_007073 [Acacia crassicarpa]